jgi:hypothetical protein
VDATFAKNRKIEPDFFTLAMHWLRSIKMMSVYVWKGRLMIEKKKV